MNKTDVESCLIAKQKELELELEKLKEALKTIMINTINRDFNGDISYKWGVLSNIRIALGDDIYNNIEENYN